MMIMWTNVGEIPPIGFHFLPNSHNQSVTRVCFNFKIFLHKFEEFTQDRGRTALFTVMPGPLPNWQVHLPKSPNSPVLSLVHTEPSTRKVFPSSSKRHPVFRVQIKSHLLHWSHPWFFPPRRWPLHLLNLPLSLNLLQAASLSDLAPSLPVLKAAPSQACVRPSLTPLKSLPRAWHTVVLSETSAETHWWYPKLIIFIFYHFSYSPVQLSDSSGWDGFSLPLTLNLW